MFLTYAANIISGYMDIPVAPLGFLQGKKNLREKPLWCKVTVNKEQFSGDVYSIDVDKWHHYVSGGAIVHNSVKGGEADCCYLFPDVSRAGMREYLTAGEPRDSVYRLMYVGMTRAKESLILCAPSSNLSVRW